MAEKRTFAQPITVSDVFAVVSSTNTPISTDSSGNLYLTGTTIAGAAGTPATSGGASSIVTLPKTITAVADNVATTVFTVTVPNPTVNNNATIFLSVHGVMGAGGSVGAGEATAGSFYVMSCARTVGLATVITTGAQLGVAASKVAGGDTFTCVIAASSVSGGNSATQTFTIQATAHDSTASGTNHVVTVLAELINSNASGITIA